MQINRENLKWAARIMLILLLVAVADGLVAEFARKPFPWVVLIPVSLPVLNLVFVLIPMRKAGGFSSPDA